MASGSGAGGNVRLTANGVLNESAAPQYIYGVVVESTAGGGGVVKLYNGTAATGNPIFQGQGTANQSAVITGIPTYGFYFPKGCYITMDANTTAVDVNGEQLVTV